MSVNIIKGLLGFIALFLAQVLVLNHVHLFQCATPFIYIYVILGMRRNVPKWLVLLCGFLAGVMIDIFSNTPGVTSTSLTFIALLQPYLLLLFINRESPDDLKPSLRTLGATRYTYFSLSLVFIYCLLFFTLEMFNLSNWLQWIECVLGSTVITFVFVLVIENMRKRNG